MHYKLIDKVKSRVSIGEDLQKEISIGKNNQFANPAVNVVGSNSVNAVIEVAKLVNSPVILHTDNAARKLSQWIDALLDAGETFYGNYGMPLFSSQMLDLSEESIEDNKGKCKRYLERMSKIVMTLEIEIDVTGGEEDGADNTGIDNSKLYTQPQEVAYDYEELNNISPNFTVAAAFGNVHGVYKPGNVKLSPIILKNSQDFIEGKFKTGTKPVNFVFHGGSGSSRAEIREAISYGVVKMNIDTDTQWAAWDGVRKYEATNRKYLQGQIGNPEVRAKTSRIKNSTIPGNGFVKMKFVRSD